jgi:hypothetical protein
MELTSRRPASVFGKKPPDFAHLGQSLRTRAALDQIYSNQDS